MEGQTDSKHNRQNNCREGLAEVKIIREANLTKMSWEPLWEAASPADVQGKGKASQGQSWTAGGGGMDLQEEVRSR